MWLPGATTASMMRRLLVPQKSPISSSATPLSRSAHGYPRSRGYREPVNLLALWTGSFSALGRYGLPKGRTGVGGMQRQSLRAGFNAMPATSAPDPNAGAAPSPKRTQVERPAVEKFSQVLALTTNRFARLSQNIPGRRPSQNQAGSSRVDAQAGQMAPILSAP